MGYKRKYCEICSDICPNDVDKVSETNSVFSAYSSHDKDIVLEINNTIADLNNKTSVDWISWENDMDIENNMIFCEICKNIYSSKAILIELSDLNFNVIFEYGYSIGINKKIHPIVNNDFDFNNIDRFFEPLLGIGIGKYEKNKLSTKLLKKKFWEKAQSNQIYSFCDDDVLDNSTKIDSNYLLYLPNTDNPQVSEEIEFELERALIDIIYDNPNEGINNLAWYSKQIKRSYAVIIDLGMSSLTENLKHFLKCAFIAGLAVSTGRRTLIINSVHTRKPSDIISIIKSYNKPKNARSHVYKFLNTHSNSFSIINAYLSTKLSSKSTIFDKINLGEHVAENDLSYLKSCFLETPEFYSLSKLGYKILIGRKGTGKTAAFLKFREERKEKNEIVINQLFDKYNLNDIYNLTLTFKNDNDKNKILIAFWKFIIFSLLSYHIAKKIKSDDKTSFFDKDSPEAVFMDYYQTINFLSNGKSITENLIDIISKIREGGVETVKEIQQKFYQNDILSLRNQVINYLVDCDKTLYFTIDGLDANLTLKNNSQIISIILFNLHEVCSTLFRKKLQNISINLFIRTDLYDSFKDKISEKDKLNKIYFKWNDEALIRLINYRLKQNEINHIADILSEDLNMNIFIQKMDKFVFKRPRDYIYVFNTLIQLAQSHKKNSINSRIFNEALEYYAIHINESIEAELMSLPFEIQPSTLFNNIKHINNDKEKIPIEMFDSTLDYFKLSDDEKKKLLVFLLKNSILFIMENNKPIEWQSIIDPISKINIILSSTERIYLLFHPIIKILLERYY